MPASRPPARPASSSRPGAARGATGSKSAAKAVPAAGAKSGSAARGGATAARGAGEPKAKKSRLAKVTGTVSQLRQVATLTYSTDKALPLWLLAAFLPLPLIGLVVGLLIGGGVGSTVYYTVIGAVLGVLAALIVFGRRAEKAAYARLGDSPGAAAAAMNTLRKGWTVEPGVGGTRTLEVVHRAVGRPGIVLVGEGPSDSRLSQLLANETRRHQRVAPDTPVIQVLAGSTPGRVPVRRLPRHLGKLPSVLAPSDVTQLNRRLKALGIGAPKMPAGPAPRGVRMPKGLRPPAGDADTGGKPR